MKCPNCNKEVSPEFNVCPWCGYKPKKCSKPEHQDVWLPVEARFCPCCGEPLPDVKGATKPNESQAKGHSDSLNANLEFEIGGVPFKMIRVEGGSFLMGATSEQGSDARDAEKPVHRVTLSDYYIGETVVTQALWKAVMGDNPSFRKGDNLPVESVSWDDCQEFLKQLSEKTGKTFRLPTEAQWEYAARGGRKSQGFRYAGSNDIDKVAWYAVNSGYSDIHQVQQKVANELGLYDMSGNVWEWCQDEWRYNYNAVPNDSFRVIRGGNCRIDALYSRVSSRHCCMPVNRNFTLGFRLVLQ